jgi:hypothetical protein
VIALTRRSSRHAVVGLGALVVLAMTIGAQSAQSASYSNCSLSESQQDPPGTKPTYNSTPLKKKNTSCKTARKVLKSFHKCRAKRSAVCSHKIRTHWTCSGHRTSTSDTVFYGTFTCKWGNRRVKGSYGQNI